MKSLRQQQVAKAIASLLNPAGRGDFVGPAQHRDLAHLHEVHANGVVDVRFGAAFFRQMLELIIVLDRGANRFVRMVIILEDEVIVGDRVAATIAFPVGRTVRGGNTVASRFTVQLTVQFSLERWIWVGASHRRFLTVVGSRWLDAVCRMQPRCQPTATRPWNAA